MPKHGDDLSTLFRSLGPDDAKLQETTNAAVREAKQRWPLFKAVSPKKPELTPALSEQEKQHRSEREKPETGKRKPALSLPGLSDKLAVGLSKMSGRAATGTAAVKPAVRAEQEKPAREGRAVSNRTPAKNRAAPPSAEHHADPDHETERDGLGIFAKKIAEPIAAKQETPSTARADDSLANIFSRLQGQDEIAEKPAGKRSSFLGRLAKR